MTCWGGVGGVLPELRDVVGGSPEMSEAAGRNTETSGGDLAAETFFALVPTCARCLREMEQAREDDPRVWQCPECGLVRILPTE